MLLCGLLVCTEKIHRYSAWCCECRKMMRQQNDASQCRGSHQVIHTNASPLLCCADMTPWEWDINETDAALRAKVHFGKLLKLQKTKTTSTVYTFAQSAALYSVKIITFYISQTAFKHPQENMRPFLHCVLQADVKGLNMLQKKRLSYCM